MKKTLSTDELTVLRVLVEQMDERRVVDSIYELDGFARPKLDGLLQSLAEHNFIRVHEGKPADGPFLSWVDQGRGRAEQALRCPAKGPDIKA